jgi:carboxypeptidase C (cathepsin A)
MGAFGPKMVKLESNGMAPPPPYAYVDNPNCLLDTGDMVFIDAMGTGYSRPSTPALGTNFGGVDNDLAAFGEFIRSFLNEYNLWGSPLFVGGESYGTTRAAGLSGYLADHDIAINGVMLLSAVIDANAAAGEQRQLSTLPTESRRASFPRASISNTSLMDRGRPPRNARRCLPIFRDTPDCRSSLSAVSTCGFHWDRSVRNLCAIAT